MLLIMQLFCRVVAMCVAILVHVFFVFIQLLELDNRQESTKMGQPLCSQYLFSEQVLNWIFYPFCLISCALWVALCWWQADTLKKHSNKIVLGYISLIFIWLIFLNVINVCI